MEKRDSHEGEVLGDGVLPGGHPYEGCLLYTSDAAADRISVDLGGRRPIEKNTSVEHLPESLSPSASHTLPYAQSTLTPPSFSLTLFPPPTSHPLLRS